MLAELNAPIPEEVSVTVSVSGKELSAKAVVRHTRQVCSWFRIGFEFDRDLFSERVPALTAVLDNARIVSEHN